MPTAVGSRLAREPSTSGTQAKKPIIFVGRIPQDIKADIVATDIQYGTMLAMEYLYEKGHRRIGLVTVAASLSVYSFRLAAWREALGHHGIPTDDALVVSGELSTEAGRKALCPSSALH